YYACGAQDFPEMTELLLKRGANACDGESVFHAADEGHEKSLVVIERYADNKKLAKECTWALPTLLSWGRVRGMRWLLAHGADPNALHKDSGNSALHEAIRRGLSEKVIDELLRAGANPTVKNREGKTAIDLAKSRKARNRLEMMTNS